MIDSLIVKVLNIKNSLFTAAREKKRIEEFIISSPEVRQVISDLKHEETFHILLHSHYDPAWFARRNITRKMLGAFYKKVIRLLGTNSDYKFTADSQTQVIEDFLSNLTGKKKSSIKKKLSEYIADGRLVVGPYYAGIDLNLSSGAVLRRNILYGMSDTRELGWNGAHVGWMIDQFGFPAQMWQLHKKFGIESIILWRGLGLKPDEAKAEILLESPDGSRILGKWLFVQGYRFGLYVGKYSDIGVPRLIQESKKINKYTVSNQLLIMDGYEGEDTPDNPEKVIKMMRKIKGNIKISSPRIFMSELVKNVDGKVLPVVRGYQNYGYYSPVLRGVISARQYIKQAHQLCDDTLTRLLDPSAVLAEYFQIGQDWSKIEFLWRNLIRMASHDELGGCGIDDVHRDSFNLYKDIYRKSVSIIKQNLSEITEDIYSDIPEIYSNKGKADADGIVPITFFNTLPYERTDIVRLKVNIPSGWKSIAACDGKGIFYDVQILNVYKKAGDRKLVELLLYFDNGRKLPAFGYKTLFISNEHKNHDREENQISSGSNWMENGLVRVEINKNGTFNLINKETGKIYRKLGYLKVEPDGGDTYDFSHIKNHDIITSLDATAVIRKKYSGRLETRFMVKYTLMVPSAISEDRFEWKPEKTPLDITILLTVRKGSERVDIGVFVDNTLKDSRIRVCFPVDSNTDSMFVNRQFDVYKMPLNISDLSVEEKEEIFRHMSGMISSGMDVVDVKTNINFKWIDIPVIDRTGNSVNESFGIINRDNFEFEIRNDDRKEKIVEFTLLRSVGWNARADLLTRNINAGWEIYTPDAFCFGRYYFPFSLIPHPGDWKAGRLNEESDKRDTEIQSLEIKRQKGSFPAEFSLFKINTKSVIISEITKNKDDPKKIVFILYNPGESTDSIIFTFLVKVKTAFIIDLDGKHAGEVASGGRKEFSISLGKKEILELAVELEEFMPSPSGKQSTRELKKKIKKDFMGIKLLENKLGLEMKPAVSKDEAESEKRRWMMCKKLYIERLVEQKHIPPAENLDEFIRKFRNDESLINLENTVKEAHYSYLLTLKRYYETEGKGRAANKVERSIARMGKQLINLRVKKREAEIYRIFFENLKISE